MTDEKYIKLCLNLAKKGYGNVQPNPMVGCVITKHNRIVGKGHHKYFGGPHAEIYAIREAKAKCKNAILYVNIEPCCHLNKKTPPCIPEILKSGIKKVVIAMKDPNPAVCGRGIRKLKRDNIKVKVGILESEAKELNKVYIKYITRRIPYCILKSAMSLDGKIATGKGESKWITSQKAIKYVHDLRKQVDAVLVGINTVIKDNPFLTTHNKGGNPSRVIIDPNLRIPLKSNVLNNKSQTVIVTAKKKDKVKLESLTKRGVKFIFLEKSADGIMNFKQIMRILLKMSIFSVLIEGGSITSANALKSGIVDEVLFFVAPKIIGGEYAKTPVGGTGIGRLSDAIKIDNTDTRFVGQDILIRGKVIN